MQHKLLPTEKGGGAIRNKGRDGEKGGPRDVHRAGASGLGGAKRKSRFPVLAFTCALCGKETRQGIWGLCTKHFYEYRDVQFTLTGTFYLPEWLRIFSKEHHVDECRQYHYREIVFSDMIERETPTVEVLSGLEYRRGG
jgi:hypothetical protein